MKTALRETVLLSVVLAALYAISFATAAMGRFVGGVIGLLLTAMGWTCVVVVTFFALRVGLRRTGGNGTSE